MDVRVTRIKKDLPIVTLKDFVLGRAFLGFAFLADTITLP